MSEVSDEGGLGEDKESWEFVLKYCCTFINESCWKQMRRNAKLDSRAKHIIHIYIYIYLVSLL